MRNIGVRYLVARKLKSKTLWYWQPTKPLLEAGFIARRLSDNLNEAILEAEAFNKRLDAWRNGENAPAPAARPGSLQALAELFQRDDGFTRLKERTQRDFLYNVKPALEWAGDAPVRAITRRAIKAWLRGLGESRGPSAARGAGAALRLLLSFACDEGWITEHPALKLRLPTPPSRDRVWTVGEREQFKAKAVEMNRASIALAIDLGWWLAQRPADLRNLARTAYDGERMRLRQAKTGKVVAVPVLPELRRALEAAPATDSVQWVVNEQTGRPYGESAFQHIFADIREAAGLPADLQFRDLRRTGATNLGRAGCTDDEIRAITGHTTREVVSIYVRPDDSYAKNAMAKLHRAGQAITREDD